MVGSTDCTEVLIRLASYSVPLEVTPNVAIPSEIGFTVGQLVRLFFQGWLAAPLTYFLLIFGGRSLSRDSNAGCGDWRRSPCALGWVFVCLLCCLSK